MKVELIDHSPIKKELKIEVDAEAVAKAFNRVSDEYARQANIPGFRRGHAPRNVAQTRFKNEIRSDVLRELLPQAVGDAIEQHELRVLGEPELHFDNPETMNRFGKEPIEFHAHVEVWPQIELPNYKGVEVARRVRPVSDADMEEVIANLREGEATLEPVEDESAGNGDTVTINIVGKFLDTPDAEDINVSDIDVELGSEGVQAEFTDNLLGVKADEGKTFVVDYPADFTSPGLAGKRVEYTATIVAVRRKALPELNDEWAQSLEVPEDETTVESVADLRARIRQRLEAGAKNESDARLRSDALNALVEAHDFEIPQALIEAQSSNLLEESGRELIMRGLDPQQMGREFWTQYRERLKPQAVRDVRAALMLERIAEEEQIEVGDAEVETEIERIIAAARQPAEQVRAALTKDEGKRSIADRLRNKKVLDLIAENARITEEEWREEEADEMEALDGEDDADATSGDTAAMSASATDPSDDAATAEAASNDSESNDKPTA